MPRIIVSSLIGLDSAVQAPGASDDDTAGGGTPDEVARGVAHDGPPSAVGPVRARAFWTYI